MLRQATRARRWITLASGVTGVVVAHLVAYVLAYSDAHQRAAVLHDTGHGYFSIVIWLAFAVATMTVATVAAKGARGTLSIGAGSVVPGVGPLALWQGLLFLAVEASERAVAGASLAEMLHGHEILIGLAVQVVVAAAIVLLLLGTDRLSARIANAFRHPLLADGHRARLRPIDARPCRRLVGGTTRSRAPPARAVPQPL